MYFCQCLKIHSLTFVVDKLEAEKQWKHIKHTHPYPTRLRFDYKEDKEYETVTEMKMKLYFMKLDIKEIIAHIHT